MPKSTVTVSDIFTNMTCCVVNRADRFHEWQTEVAVKNNNVSYERPPKKNNIDKVSTIRGPIELPVNYEFFIKYLQMQIVEESWFGTVSCIENVIKVLCSIKSYHEK